MKKLGGWWRLWIALSAIWFVTSGAIGVFLGLDAYKAYKVAHASYAGDALHCNDSDRNVSHGPWENYAPQSPQYIVSSPSGAHYLVKAPAIATTSQVMAFAELSETFVVRKSGHTVPWRQIMQNPAYQALPLEQKEAVREEYFQEVVAPQIADPTQRLQAKQQFDAETNANPFDQFDNPSWRVRLAASGNQDNVGEISAWSIKSCISDQQLASNATEIASIKTNTLIYILAMLAPPTILLLLGLLVSWVLGGFRKASA